MVVTSNVVEFPTVKGGLNTIADHVISKNIPKLQSTRKLNELYEEIDKILFINKNNQQKDIPDTIIKNINADVERIALNNGVIFLNKEDFICNAIEKKCTGFTDEGFKTYADRYHFTLKGAEYFGRKMAKIDWLLPLKQRLP